jgi:putative FmdB family regulatory protein
MPIYEYLCSACGVKKEHLQKISDARLTVCPDCGKPTYEKQLTAAGFQLKGSGWYVTDFKGGGSTSAAPVKKDEASAGDSAKDSGSKDSGTKDSGTKDSASGTSTSSTTATTTPAAATPTTPASGA